MTQKNNDKYFITRHCQDRYLERVRNDQNTSPNLLLEILKTIYAGKDITNKVRVEVPRFILYLYEKYKSAGFKIVTNENIIFITQKRKGSTNLFDVITCYYDTGKFLEQYKNTALTRQEIFSKISAIKKTL